MVLTEICQEITDHYVLPSHNFKLCYNREEMKSTTSLQAPTSNNGYLAARREYKHRTPASARTRRAPQANTQCVQQTLGPMRRHYRKVLPLTLPLSNSLALEDEGMRQ